VLDYAHLGWDADLETVRMGARDYDPRLSQFWTPDPLYLESLEKCQASPVECGLYGYANNNPLSNVDPAGTDSSKDGYWNGRRVSDQAPPFGEDLDAEQAQRFSTHRLSNSDKVHTSIDYRYATWRVEQDYEDFLPSHTVKDSWWTWSASNGGRAEKTVYEQIPKADLAEYKTWLEGLNDGSSKWQITTQHGYTFEMWMGMGEKGVVTNGVRSGNATESTGWTFTTSDASTNTIGGSMTAGLGAPGASATITASHADTHTDTTGTSGGTTGGRTSSFETKNQAERGYLWVRVTDPKDRVVWHRMSPSSGQSEAVVSHALSPM
jgi:RHS repeat-associated protein